MQHDPARRIALASLTGLAAGSALSLMGCATPAPVRPASTSVPQPVPAPDPESRAIAAAALPGGVWTSDQRSRGGLGETLAFHRGGDVVHAMASIIDARYIATADTLTLNAQARDDDPATVLVCGLAFEGETLVLRPRTDEPGKAAPMVLRRAAEFAALAPRSLVGTWDYVHPLGRAGRMRFTSDGRALLLVNLQSRSGHFEAKDGRLALHLQGQPAQSFGLRFEGGHMLLSGGPGEGTPEKSFSRFVVS